MSLKLFECIFINLLCVVKFTDLFATTTDSHQLKCHCRIDFSVDVSSFSRIYESDTWTDSSQEWGLGQLPAFNIMLKGFIHNKEKANMFFFSCSEEYFVCPPVHEQEQFSKRYKRALHCIASHGFRVSNDAPERSVKSSFYIKTSFLTDNFCFKYITS